MPWFLPLTTPPSPPYRNAKLIADPTRSRQISERIPAGRWGEPRDFAGPIVFLASHASQYVSGELLVVDGVRPPPKLVPITCVLTLLTPPFPPPLPSHLLSATRRVAHVTEFTP